jgi:hypothetical protein
VYWVREIHSNGYEIDRSAIATRMRSRRVARAEEFARWVAEAEESRDERGAQPRSAHNGWFRGRTVRSWLRTPAAAPGES